VVYHEYDCSRPPPSKRGICPKRVYAQAEL
jgi:hypothetical protein